MTLQNDLVLLLKQKGTGQTMSKQLDADQLDQLSMLMASPDVFLVTKATMLTAMLMLPATEDEAQWVAIMKRNPRFLPSELHSLFIHPHDISDPILRLILQATQHENLSYDAFKAVMHAILHQEIPDYLQAIFLEAARLKRESLVENTAGLDVLWDATSRLQTDLPLLIDLAHPYDGFSRNMNLSVFIAMKLGQMGYPTLLHGMDETSPKNGITPYKILKAMGEDPCKPSEDVYQDLLNPKKRWGYCDQSVFATSLYQLKTLRKQMVKRPILSTIEKFLQPIRAQHGNLVFTGYTHPPYKPMTSAILNHHSRTAGFTIVRGVEGSAQVPLDRRCPFITHFGQHDTFISPSDLGMQEYPRQDAIENLTVESCIKEGLDALAGKPGFAKDCITYNCRVILNSFGLTYDS